VLAALGALLRAGNARILAAEEDRLRHAALARDIALAREIQAGLLARPDTWFPGQDRFAIAATIHPAKEVGGDLYEALPLDADRLLLAVGDVSGKGIGAALFMMRALTLLRATAPTAPDLLSLAATLNAGLVEGNEAGMFVTLFLGVLDLRSGLLEGVNCGHGAPLLRDAKGPAAFHGFGPSPPLGLFEGARFAAGRIALPPGATLLLCSDGVTEAMDAAGQEFGAEAFRAAVAAAPPGPPARLLDHVLAAVRAHAGDAPQADDITLLALRWHGESQAAPGASGTDASPL
jgi:sigma-B regulation protein RsbU (phosphoserine phosphatase)